jgi:hypothetical protein
MQPPGTGRGRVMSGMSNDFFTTKPTNVQHVDSSYEEMKTSELYEGVKGMTPGVV